MGSVPFVWMYRGESKVRTSYTHMDEDWDAGQGPSEPRERD